MTLRRECMADPFGQLTGASVFVGGIALVRVSELRPWAGGQREDRRAPFARRSGNLNFGVSRARLTQRIGRVLISPVKRTGSSFACPSFQTSRRWRQVLLDIVHLAANCVWTLATTNPIEVGSSLDRVSATASFRAGREKLGSGYRTARHSSPQDKEAGATTSSGEPRWTRRE